MKNTPTSYGLARGTVEAWMHEYAYLAQAQESTEAGLLALLSAAPPPPPLYAEERFNEGYRPPSAPAGMLDADWGLTPPPHAHHPSWREDASGAASLAFSLPSQIQYEHRKLELDRREAAAALRQNVRMTRTAMLTAIQAAEGHSPHLYTSGGGNRSEAGTPTAAVVAVSRQHATATARALLQQVRLGLAEELTALRAEESYLSADAEEGARRLLRDLAYPTAAAAPSRARAHTASDRDKATPTATTTATTTAAATKTAADLREDYFQAQVDALQAEFNALLAQYGGHTLGWAEPLHDRFLRVVLQVHRMSGGEGGGAADLPPVAELREAALEALGGLVPPHEIEQHVELYLRYMTLVQQRRAVLERYQLERAAVAARSRCLHHYQAQYSMRVAQEAEAAKEARRRQRQRHLKAQVQQWRSHKAEQEAAAREAATTAEAAKAAARAAAASTQQQRREAQRQQVAAARAARAQAAEVAAAAASAKEAAALQERRQRAQQRRAQHEAEIQQARARYEARHRDEVAAEQAALAAQMEELGERGEGGGTYYTDDSRPRFWDPTTSSLRRTTATMDPLLPIASASAGTAAGERRSLNKRKDEWLEPSAQERWQSSATVHSVLYKPHTSTPSWCRAGFQL